ncbi:unnamed protein product [Gulo gulo]|uniref:Uncharacterized protein n=1 Tax=Gulo gulo TaxID=48420 RepID=A0A9X9Q5T1_GULGU|nr:unnamed protein product [Gulo gulo]
MTSEGRRLSPENQGGNLSLKQGKWDGSGAQNPSCLQRRHRGPQAVQPPTQLPGILESLLCQYKKQLYNLHSVSVLGDLIIPYRKACQVVTTYKKN